MNKEKPGLSKDKYSLRDEVQVDDEREKDQEILSGPTAKSVLPYLTLDKLSDHEKADVIRLAEVAFDGAASGAVSAQDKIDYTKYVETKTASLVGEDEAWADGFIRSKLGEARKLLCSCIINGYNHCEDIESGHNVYQTFFSFTPGLDSYCGGLKDNLEMLGISERSNKRMCTQNLYGEITYEYSFTDANGFEDVLENASPIEQLRLMPVIFNVSEHCQPDAWSNRALDMISRAYSSLIDNEDSAPLVKLVAEGLNRQIDRRLNSEWAYIDMDDPEYIIAKLEHEERVRRIRERQDELHQDFPNLPEDNYLEIIAPGIAGAFNGARLSEISNKKGAKASLLEYNQDNDFDIDFSSAQLLIALHDLEVKDCINGKLGIDLASVSLDAQIHLLKFMAEAGDDRFDKLCSTLHRVDEKTRLKLAESFLAADFGEDFGDALLDIANSGRISGEQLEEILDKIGSCRESIREISGLYDKFDGGVFASQYARAANERLTDAITVFREIANNGSAQANLGWPGVVEFDYNKAMEALNYEAKSLDIISGTFGDVVAGKEGAFAELLLTPDESRTRSMYSFYSPEHGYVLLYTRPEASSTFDGSFEYGNRDGVEASISFIVNPVDPFELPTPYKPNPKAARNPNYYDPATMDRVSAIRIDREGRSLDMAANDPRRHPLNHEGVASVDLAAIGDRADTPSGKIARLFSVGNALRAARVGGEIKLNHNTNWFDQDKYGTDVGFKDVVNYVDRLAMTWCTEHPSSEDQGFRAAARRARPSAGHRRSAA